MSRRAAKTVALTIGQGLAVVVSLALVLGLGWFFVRWTGVTQAMNGGGIVMGVNDEVYALAFGKLALGLVIVWLAATGLARLVKGGRK